MSQAILFKKCLGLNDARALASFSVNPRTGSTELLDALNLTTTPDGCVEKVAQLVAALTHSSPITNISAGNRFIYQDGVDTKEWNGSASATIGAILDGPVAHTPIDCRIATNSQVFKSTFHGAAVSLAGLGDTSALPSTSKPYYGMPVFKQAFVYNAKQYGINAADPRFIQYSEDYHYDVYALGDNHFGHIDNVLQAGAIPGVMLATHSFGVVAYVGTGPNDFVKKGYACAFIDKTLFSGFISKVYGYSHVFLCDDGVYAVGQDGAFTNLTVDQTDHLDVLNNQYYAVTVQDGKYLAFGDLCCIEYDFKTKTLLKRSTFGVTSACVWNNRSYVAKGNTVCTLGTEIDTSGAFGCSLTLPYSDWSVPGKKSVESFYFTGTIIGDWTLTLTDQNGEYWELERSDELVNVSNYRIKTPKRMMGNHLSLKIECTAGAFRLEELRATFAASNRSK